MGPLRRVGFLYVNLILVLPGKVVFCFKGAVPPLTNSYVLLLFFIVLWFKGYIRLN